MKDYNTNLEHTETTLKNTESVRRTVSIYLYHFLPLSQHSIVLKVISLAIDTPMQEKEK